MKPDVGLSLFIQRKRPEQPEGLNSMSGSSQGNQKKEEQAPKVVDTLDHEEILKYLSNLESKLLPKEDEALETMKEEVWSKLFPYRERYLEYVVNLGENVDKYQTMLGQLYIENLFKIQSKHDKDDGIIHPKIIKPRREKLIQFLEEKSNYNPEALLQMVMDSWMFEEKILLLVKKKMYDEAIKIFVDNEQFIEAEEFCKQRPQLALMTNLFCVYIK